MSAPVASSSVTRMLRCLLIALRDPRGETLEDSSSAQCAQRIYVEQLNCREVARLILKLSPCARGIFAHEGRCSSDTGATMVRHHSWTTKSFRIDVTPQRKRCGASGLPGPLQSMAGIQNAAVHISGSHRSGEETHRQSLIRLLSVADSFTAQALLTSRQR